MPELSADAAAALHERLFTIDTHSDTPTASFERDGWDFSARHDRVADDSQIDLPRMRAGGVDAMVFAVYVPQAARTPAGHAAAHALALGHFERTHQQLARCRVECGLALTADDALRLKAEGKRAIFLSIENSYSLGRDPANVEKFFQLGGRMIGLTHMLNNDLADSSTDPRGAEWGGLSALGREMVAECNRLGIVVDASHASDDVLRDLLDRSRAPVMLSHSDCRAICDHPRNIGDELLRALAAKGGMLQMNALPISLVDAPGNGRTAASAEVLLRFKDVVISPEMLAAADREYHQVAIDHPNPTVTRDDFLRHLEHAVAVAGAEHVGIGCDLDGGGGGFEGLRDVSDFPRITSGLVARGWREDVLVKVWGENTLRLFRTVQQGAG